MFFFFFGGGASLSLFVVDIYLFGFSQKSLQIFSWFVPVNSGFDVNLENHITVRVPA